MKKTLIFNIVMVVMVLVVVEVLSIYTYKLLEERGQIFSLVPMTDWYIELVGRAEDEYEFSAETGWDVKRGYVLNEPTKNFIVTNNVGARSFTDHQQGDHVLISIYGDSFAFGYEVGNKDSWSHLLEQGIKRRVLNFGVPGFGSCQAYVKYAQVTRDIDPDIVMFCVFPEDISRVPTIYHQFFFRHKPRLTKPGIHLIDGVPTLIQNPIRTLGDMVKLKDQAVLDEFGRGDYWYQYYDQYGLNNFKGVSHTVELFKNMWFYFDKVGFARSMQAVASGERVFQSHYEQMYDLKDTFNAMKHVVDLLSRRTAERGAELVVVILPGNLDMKYHATHNRYSYQPLLNYLASKEIDMLDLTPVFESEIQSGKTYADLFVRDGIGHFTPYGNRVAADNIAMYLLTNPKLAALVQAAPKYEN